MLYTKNDKRFSQESLNKSGIKNPVGVGYTILKDNKPNFNKFTHYCVDVGTKNGEIVYEIKALNDKKIQQVLKEEIKRLKIEAIKNDEYTIELFEKLDLVESYLELPEITKGKIF